MKKVLNEVAQIRFFKGDKKIRKDYMKFFVGRWENDSHFVRSAVQQFIRQLDKEKLNIYLERKQKQRAK